VDENGFVRLGLIMQSSSQRARLQNHHEAGFRPYRIVTIPLKPQQNLIKQAARHLHLRRRAALLSEAALNIRSGTDSDGPQTSVGRYSLCPWIAAQRSRGKPKTRER
jgi:hypothetical protein